MVKLFITFEPYILNTIIDFLDYETYNSFLKIFPKQYQLEIITNYKKYCAYKNNLCKIISEMFFQNKISNTTQYMYCYTKIFNGSTDSNIVNLKTSIYHRLNVVTAFNFLLYKLNESDANKVTKRQIKNISSHLIKSFNCYTGHYIRDVNFYINNKNKLISHSLNALNNDNSKNMFLKIFKEID